MIFGPVPLAEAEGALLAHSVQVDGQRIRKGVQLTATQIEALGVAGLSEVVVARLERGDLHEDAAASHVYGGTRNPPLACPHVHL